ncbi:MAG: site-specific DNA-methyltransferase, partial [Synechococcaceae bacterium WB9_3_282]|nr:site-specific DNA-methyltransferase [Synechococcaceae bacterium WB9_3_282]
IYDLVNTAEATKTLAQIFGKKDLFENPKPYELIKYLLTYTTRNNDIILDSFAGSGTTAHAVLDLNKEDGGNRKFILVEMEDYANSITAERVRRVINGVETAKDEKLKQGLGGSFTFCKLGDEFNIEKILTGEALPKYEALANYVFYTATGKSLETPAKQKIDYFVGETDLFEVYLIYQPDIAFLRSNESALNAKMVEIISQRSTSKKQKLVFASAKYMGQNELNDHKIIFCQLPYAIHKIAGK